MEELHDQSGEDADARSDGNVEPEGADNIEIGPVAADRRHGQRQSEGEERDDV